jgi:hypothetical protein
MVKREIGDEFGGRRGGATRRRDEEGQTKSFGRGDGADDEEGQTKETEGDGDRRIVHPVFPRGGGEPSSAEYFSSVPGRPPRSSTTVWEENPAEKTEKTGQTDLSNFARRDGFPSSMLERCHAERAVSCPAFPVTSRNVG